MSTIKESRKFKRTKTQDNPMSLEGVKDKKNKQFSIDNDTIIEEKDKS
ncbi:hypothetical protein [Polaribacter sp. Asnod1-A03]